MTMWRYILAVAIAAPLACATLGGLSGLAQAETQGIVAVANDQPITERDITLRIELRKTLGDMPTNGLTRKQALQNLIDDQVKLAEATRLMLLPSEAEVTDRVTRLAKSQKMTRVELLAKIKALGISEAAFRLYLQASIGFSRIIAAKFRDEITASPAEVDAKIAEIDNTIGAQMRKLMNDPRMQPMTLYSLLEISLPLDGDDPGLLQARAVEAQQVLRQFKGCANARKAAEGVFNVKIGKTFEADSAKLPKPLKEAFAKLGPGRAIGPMRGNNAIQLVALCGIRKITPPKPDFKMPDRDQIERMVINEKYDKLEETYLKEARERVYVEYRDPNYTQQ
jgi:peptidyl-prolyl cis-trans isomerase SurA